MDRINPYPYNIYHYYSHTHQDDGQHPVQPEAGQTSTGVMPGETSGNHPASIPSSPGSDWQYILQSPPPFTLEEIILPQPMVGQTSSGVLANETSGWFAAPDQPYLNSNSPAQIPSSSGPEGEYILRSPLPISATEIIQNDAPQEPTNPQPVRRKARKGMPPAKERFLAGLEAFAQGVSIANCSSELPFSDYIKTDGTLVKYGVPLLKQLTAAEKTKLNNAIIARQEAKRDRKDDKSTTQERLLAALDLYAQGVKLAQCSKTIKLKNYLTDNGYLHTQGTEVYNSLLPEDKARVDKALIDRNNFYYDPLNSKDTTKRFLEGLDNYASGKPLKDCSATLEFKTYVTDEGRMHKTGRNLYNRMSPEDQGRVNRALIARLRFHSEQVADNDTTVERFLASLDNYEGGIPLRGCAQDIRLYQYLTEAGDFQRHGQSIYNRLRPDDRMRVDEALTARKEKFSQLAAKDVDAFMNTLKPYADGLSLDDCGNRSGLKKRKANAYLTPEGGLTPKGELLIRNLQPSQLNEVQDAIAKRQWRTESNTSAPESSQQQPEMPSSIPGINPAAMAAPTQMGMTQTETMTQTEAMWATVWQLTGQAGPGPSASTEPHIVCFDRDIAGADFQHQD
jgi:hypothetical protein